MPHKAVKTAVFPVAGRGTRFLPVTKASPKEMLPIVDKPLIQYAVDEALSAGADTLVFITGSSKRAIEDHFDSNPELESVLQAQGKQELLDTLRGILPSWASCVYIRQPAPLGLGHAVLCARPVVGDAPFMVHLADDLIDATVPCLKQMVDVFALHGGSVLGVQNVPKQDTDKYGIVTLERKIALRIGKMSHIVEKPKPEKAASTLAVVGRYLLTPAVFDDLSKIGKGAGGEIQLTDGIAQLMQREPVYAFEFEGKRYD
ncbi:MAG TPA: UTP--glucose-1-phosphate uridylyltransferase GalU, partial [Steroidobacteraceae bacterium]